MDKLFETLNMEEIEYLKLCNKIIEDGNLKTDRTGTGTKSLFGAQMRFSLRNNKLPLLTTKFVSFKAVATELLWFISGSTSSHNLAEQGVNIWNANGSREFLDSLRFYERETGDLGPVYGFQWRHFGAEYVDHKTDYKLKGVDQLQSIIRMINTNPNDRRLIMCAWNPIDIPKMVLPPCHVLCQFYVANDELSCQLYQRSGDMGLGIPYNIASYSLLTHMIAASSGLKAGEFVHTIGDAHVYLNHIEALKLQISRKPYSFPDIHINTRSSIDDYVLEDFKIENYKHHDKILMKMAL